MKTFSIKPSKDETRTLINCPICGGSRFNPHWDCGSFTYVKCQSCGLILQNPQPHFEDLDNRYDEEYFKYEQKNDQLFFELMLMGLSDIGFNPELNPGEEEKSFLDIGCATGMLVEYMQSKGWNSCGVELCAPAAKYGEELRGVSIYSGTLEQASYEDSSFDVIHCSHLIEHLNNPSTYMDEVYRILKPGGLFLCTTPNSDGFQARIFQEKWRSSIADHMFLFSKKTLSVLLLRKSFSIAVIKTWGGIGRGYAPGFIKKVLDRSAKKFHFGDVMIIASHKK